MNRRNILYLARIGTGIIPCEARGEQDNYTAYFSTYDLAKEWLIVRTEEIINEIDLRRSQAVEFLERAKKL